MEARALRVLLVEDETAHLHLLRRAFKASTITTDVRTVSTLQEAQSMVREFDPDVVISDLLLPDGRGMELLPQNGENAAFPVIVMTSHGDEQVAVEAMRSGALDYVVKSEHSFQEMPRTAERAVREWRHILERRRAETRLQESFALLEGLLDSLSVQVAVLDEQGRIMKANAAWRRSPPHHAATPSEPGLPPPAPERADELLTGIASVLSGDMPRFTAQYLAEGDGERWFQMTVTPFQGAGAARGVVLHEDVTEYKRAEQEARERVETEARLGSLSPREREVMERVVAGKANKVIARDLEISIKTVEMHRANVMKKLHVGTVPDLVKLALSGAPPRTP